MKKLFTFFGLMILAFNLNAQITLEHTFHSEGYYTSYFITDEGTRYYSYNTTTNQLTLYNVDYSVYKTITMSIAPGYMFSGVFCVSDKLFNSDNLIEFIFVTGNGTNYSMKLYNENKSEIKDFGDRYRCGTISNNGTTKLWVEKTTYNSTTQTQSYVDDIYSLPGSLVNNVSTLKSQNSQVAYPNPTKTVINLPYTLKNGQTSTMKIYNLNGKLIEQKQINSTFNSILLNVASYRPGIYIYEYNGISNKFFVNK